LYWGILSVAVGAFDLNPVVEIYVAHPAPAVRVGYFVAVAVLKLSVMSDLDRVAATGVD
jgi:hypothetical protein